MKPVFHFALLACVLAGSAHGGEVVKPTIEVNDLQVVVKHVSSNELAILQRRHGHGVDLKGGRSHHQGFSILKRNVETGAFKCEIYLPADKRPRVVDDEATLTIGHELLHCVLGAYHE